ncbi:MAG: hypothetical protein WDN03_15530 [Rhizomicrobium sp.]
MTDAVGHTTTIAAVNGRGQPLYSTDPNGIATYYTYDALGRGSVGHGEWRGVGRRHLGQLPVDRRFDGHRHAALRVRPGPATSRRSGHRTARR